MKRRNGFTLIELLVVVAIIVILIAILMPSLGRARAQAKSVQCMANLKQIGTAFYLYGQENNDHIPIGWASLNLPTVVNPTFGSTGDARSLCEGGAYNKPAGMGMLLPMLGYTGQLTNAGIRANRPKYFICPLATEIVSLPNGVWNGSIANTNFTDYVYWRDGVSPTLDTANTWAHFGQKLNLIPDRNLSYCLAAGGYGVRYPGLHMDGSSFLFGDGHVEHLSRSQYTAYQTAQWAWFQYDTKWRH